MAKQESVTNMMKRAAGKMREAAVILASIATRKDPKGTSPIKSTAHDLTRQLCGLAEKSLTELVPSLVDMAKAQDKLDKSPVPTFSKRSK